MSTYKAYRHETLTYIKTVGKFREQWKDDIPSWIDIATITLIAQLPITLDVETIQDVFKQGSVNIKESGHSFEFKKHDSKFYNQISISYDDDKYGKRKVIKLFPNGKIHVAGCFHLMDCHRIIDLVCIIITQITNIEIEKQLIQYRIAMINTSFSLNYLVNQKHIINTFNKHGNKFKIAFNPDRYAGVKIKFQPLPDMKCVTASIFSTGKILLSGAENLKEVVYAYKTIVGILYENRDVVKVNKVPDPKINHVFMGYTMDTWMKDNTIPRYIVPWE